MGGRVSKAFQQLKDSLRVDIYLSYQDTNLNKTEVVCDAFPVGRGAILVQYQNNVLMPQIVAYNSRFLTPVEMRYGKVEKL